MLADELHEQLKSIEPDIEIIKAYWSSSKLEEEFQQLKTQIHQEDFWKHPQQAKISKRLQHIRTQREAYHSLLSCHNDLLEFVNLFADDENELILLQNEVQSLCRKIAKFKIEILLSQKQDNASCFFSINAGAGGTESQDWASILLRMYTRFCEQEGLKTKVIDYQAGEEAGIKSATLYVAGKKPYGLLKSEHGIHRLVRISPFDSAKRRHTSFAGVYVLPEVPEVEISIDPKDLRIDTYRAGGAGGQHVNKTDSAVRITHIPTNIVVQCQNERSQIQNRETAMKMLKAKLAEKAQREQKAEHDKIEKKKIEWGSQIRSYILHPYKMVKDHRTNIESPQPNLVLDGDLMKFVENYLIWTAKT